MTPAIARPAASQYRWIICGLLFFATVISYVDRGVLGYLEKYLEGIFHFDSVQYSYMTTAFQVAYAIGMVTAGGTVMPRKPESSVPVTLTVPVSGGAAT